MGCQQAIVAKPGSSLVHETKNIVLVMQIGVSLKIILNSKSHYVEVFLG